MSAVLARTLLVLAKTFTQRPEEELPSAAAAAQLLVSNPSPFWITPCAMNRNAYPSINRPSRR